MRPDLDTGLNSKLCWPYRSHLLQKMNFIRVAHQMWVFTPHFNVIYRSWKLTFHCFRPETRELSAKLTTIQRPPVLAQPDHQVCSMPCRTKTFVGIKVRKIRNCQNLESLHPLKIIYKMCLFTDNNPKHDEF